MAEKQKVTIMVLKVDLQCCKCYKKVKKVLCEFPQIRDQIYDEKQNQVVIKVVCCSPEKIRDELCCKGGGAIISIEIKEPHKDKRQPGKKCSKGREQGPPREPDQGPPREQDQGPPREQDQGPPREPDQGPPQELAIVPPQELDQGPPQELATVPDILRCPPHKHPQVRPCCMDCYQGLPGGPCHNGCPPLHKFPQVQPCCMDCYRGLPGGPCHDGCSPPHKSLQVQPCCMDCYRGLPGGPCHNGYGGRGQFIQYGGYHWRSVYDSYGGGRSYDNNYCVTRSDCFSEENPQGCIVM